MSETEDQPYQVMPELEVDEYGRLKEDIAEHGVEYPIILDLDEWDTNGQPTFDDLWGAVIDGHHRLRAWQELGNEPSEIPTRVVDDSDADQYHRAYRSNLLRRDLSDGTKREVVKEYLLEHPERVEEDTQEAIAEDLGVAQQTVSNAVQGLQERGKLTKHSTLSTKEKRDLVQSYHEDNPDASNREVAREVDCDVTHVTVGNWRSEWRDEDEEEDESTGLDIVTNSATDAQKAGEVAKKAKGGDETAQKETQRLSQNKTSLNKAHRKVEKEENKREREEKRQEQKEKIQQNYFGDDAVEPTLHVADAEDLPLDDASVDLIITSPPYNLGHGNWKMGGEGREQRDNGIGYQDDRNEREYQQWQLNVFQELYRVASDGASFFYNHKLRQTDGEVIHPMDWIRDDANPWTLRQEIVWDRESTHNHSPGIFWPVDERIYWMVKGDPKLPNDGTGMHSVWEFHGPKPDTEHPAPFPDELPRRCVEAVGQEGDVILDPFGGSMTTCEVAAKLGYESHGVDIDRSYVKKKRTAWGLDDG